MSTRNGRRTGLERYLALVENFPLVPIRNDQQLHKAHKVIDNLLRRKLAAREEQYLDVLSNLVADYDDAHHELNAPSTSEMLRHLIDASGLTLSEVARRAGIARSTISSLLSGNRELNIDHIRRFSKLFHVGPQVFFPFTPH